MENQNHLVDNSISNADLIANLDLENNSSHQLIHFGVTDGILYGIFAQVYGSVDRSKTPVERELKYLALKIVGFLDGSSNEEVVFHSTASQPRIEHDHNYPTRLLLRLKVRKRKNGDKNKQHIVDTMPLSSVLDSKVMQLKVILGDENSQMTNDVLIKSESSECAYVYGINQNCYKSTINLIP